MSQGIAHRAASMLINQVNSPLQNRFGELCFDLLDDQGTDNLAALTRLARFISRSEYVPFGFAFRLSNGKHRDRTAMGQINVVFNRFLKLRW